MRVLYHVAHTVVSMITKKESYSTFQRESFRFHTFLTRDFGHFLLEEHGICLEGVYRLYHVFLSKEDLEQAYAYTLAVFHLKNSFGPLYELQKYIFDETIAKEHMSQEQFNKYKEIVNSAIQLEIAISLSEDL